MKSVLLISFDIIRDGEPTISLAMGSLLAYLKNSEGYGKTFVVDHLSFNLYRESPLTIEAVMNTITERYSLSKLDIIALSCYVWSEYLINPLIATLKENGFDGRLILGGQQIIEGDNELYYPGHQVYICGYAEATLLSAIQFTDSQVPVLLHKLPDLSRLPSPYTNNEIHVSKNQKKVRIETQRGCMYNCTYCAHAGLHEHKVYCLPDRRVLEELDLLKDKCVEKINIIDPTFNSNKYHLRVLTYCAEKNIKSKLSLQIRLEKIRGQVGDQFLDLCKVLNTTLEFGLQTIHNAELDVLKRKNDIVHIKTIMHRLNKYDIDYEASLIFGIPNQTVASFKQCIDFLKLNGCKRIKAYGLTLLRGTRLWQEQKRWNCHEERLGVYQIPYVTSTDSFTKSDWNEMEHMAKSLDMGST